MKTILLAILFSSVAAADPTPPIGASATLDREIAIVERTPIWQSELDELLARVPAQSFSPDQKSQALSSLIDGVLLDHTATERAIQTTSAEVDAAIQEVEKQNHVDDAGLEKALAEQHFTRAQYRDELARQIRAERVFDLIVAPHVPIVTDADVLAEWAKRSTEAPTAEQRDQLRDALWANKKALATQAWLARRRAGAHIELKP